MFKDISRTTEQARRIIERYGRFTLSFGDVTALVKLYSGMPIELASCSFDIGFMQGMKAAKAEAKKQVSL